MLILTRKLGESVIIGDNIKITVVEVNKQQIKLGIDAPKNIIVHREEIYDRIKEENKLASVSNVIDIAGFPEKVNIKENSNLI